MGVSKLSNLVMDLEILVRGLKNDVEEKEIVTKALLDELREIFKTIIKVEKAISKRGDESEDKIMNKNKELDAKSRELNHLMDSLTARKEEGSSLRRTIDSLESNKLSLEKKLMGKNDEIDNLNKNIDGLNRKLADTNKIIEFKSTLEKSYESLQLKYQAKIDELEKVKKECGDQIEIAFQKPSFKEIISRY